MAVDPNKIRALVRKIPKTAPKVPAGGAIGGLVGLAALALGAWVDGGHAAIKFNKITGVGEQVYTEGTKLKIPWLEVPIIYDVRARPRSIPTYTGSKDLQTVRLTLRVLSKPDATKLPTIYRTLGVDWDERVLPSIVNEVSKSVVAQFNASQLITQRELVSRLVRKRLVERAKDFNIFLDDVAITHLNFGREYTAAVEAKQVAQQDAERAKFIVEKAQQDKLSAIIRATGEAKSAELIGAATTDNPNFIRLRQLEATRDIATILSHSDNKLYLNANSLLLNTLAGPVIDMDAKK